MNIHKYLRDENFNFVGDDWAVTSQVSCCSHSDTTFGLKYFRTIKDTFDRTFVCQSTQELSTETCDKTPAFTLPPLLSSFMPFTVSLSLSQSLSPPSKTSKLKVFPLQLYLFVASTMIIITFKKSLRESQSEVIIKHQEGNVWQSTQKILNLFLIASEPFHLLCSSSRDNNLKLKGKERHQQL
jgi:hypothetical protein